MYRVIRQPGDPMCSRGCSTATPHDYAVVIIPLMVAMVSFIILKRLKAVN
jgi:hypothetical protein